MHLHAEQRQQFDREGYVVLEDFFDEHELQPIVDELCETIELQAQALLERGEITQSWADEGFETRLSRITDETEQLLLQINRTELAGPAFFDLMVNERLLDVVEELVGPEIIASAAYRIRPKVPGNNRGVLPWHQDSGYYEPWCDRSRIVTCWIALVDSTPERGCLQLIPGRHREGVFDHWLPAPDDPYIAIRPDALPAGEVRSVPVGKGGLILMTNTTPHRSTDNLTDVIRWSVDFRYQSASLPTNHRGSNALAPQLERSPDEPVACFPPARDFLVRSRQRPVDVVRSWQRFDELRREHELIPVTDRWNIGWFR